MKTKTVKNAELEAEETAQENNPELDSSKDPVYDEERICREFKEFLFKYKEDFGKNLDVRLTAFVDYINEYNVCSVNVLVDDVKSGVFGRRFLGKQVSDFVVKYLDDNSEEAIPPTDIINHLIDVIIQFIEQGNCDFFTEGYLTTLYTHFGFVEGYITSRNNKKSPVEKGECGMRKALVLTLLAGIVVTAVAVCKKKA